MKVFQYILRLIHYRNGRHHIDVNIECRQREIEDIEQRARRVELMFEVKKRDET